MGYKSPLPLESARVPRVAHFGNGAFPDDCREYRTPANIACHEVPYLITHYGRPDWKWMDNYARAGRRTACLALLSAEFSQRTNSCACWNSAPIVARRSWPIVSGW